MLTRHYITTFFVLLSMTVSLSHAPGDHVSNINMVTDSMAGLVSRG